jgi:hypothetical protein
MKAITKIDNFSENHTGPGSRLKGMMLKIGNQPPKKRIVVIPLIINMLAYSPKKNKANPIAEYSTL